MPTLYNVYVRRVEEAARPFMSASVCVSPAGTAKEDREFFNVKVVQDFGALPKVNGFYRMEVADDSIWVDTQEGVINTIRVKNPICEKQDNVIYDTEYNQLEVIPNSQPKELKRITIKR